MPEIADTLRSIAATLEQEITDGFGMPRAAIVRTAIAELRDLAEEVPGPPADWSEDHRVATIESDECPDGIGIYVQRDGVPWVRLIAFSYQGDGAIEFPADVAVPLGDALREIQCCLTDTPTPPVDPETACKLRSLAAKIDADQVRVAGTISTPGVLTVTYHDTHPEASIEGATP